MSNSVPTGATLTEFLVETIGDQDSKISSQVLKVLAEEEIVTVDEFIEHWEGLKEKLPLKYLPKLQAASAKFEACQIDDAAARLVERYGGKAGIITGIISKVAGMPPFNLLVDFMEKDDPPTFNGVKDAMNAMGLLAALALTICMSFPSAISYDEVEAVVERFIHAPYDKQPTDFEEGSYGHWLIMIFGQSAIAATGLIASSVIVVIIFLLVTPTTGGNLYDSAEAYKCWYQWVRWLVIWVFGTLVIGLIYLFRAFTYLIMIKFPDLYVEKYRSPYSLFAGPISIYGYAWAIQGWLIVLPTALAFLIMGGGLRIMVVKASGRDAPM